MTPFEEIGDLKVKCYAVWGRMTVVSMKLAVLGDILLGVGIVNLSWPLDYISHDLHDGYTFNGLDIEVVFKDQSSVPMV